jgi:hypothetical protein
MPRKYNLVTETVIHQRGCFGVTQLAGEAWQPHFAVYRGDAVGTVIAHFFETADAQAYCDWRNGECNGQKTKK